jgi:hypothetical protein
MPKQPPVYVVVCEDLHTAHGLFVELKQAKAYAEMLTDKSDCKFFPVPLVISYGRIDSFKVNGEETDDGKVRHTGQYL